MRKLKCFSVIEILVTFLILSFLTILAIKIYSSTSETSSDLQAQQIIEVSSEAVLNTYTTRGYWVNDPAELAKKVDNIVFKSSAVSLINEVSITTTSEGVTLVTLSKSGNCLVGYVTADGLKEDKYYNNQTCDASEAP